MKKETKIAIFLLFLSPAMGELLSGSSPPLEFFNPIILVMLILLYGCGTLLVREAKGRWGLNWSIIFLAVAYGIVEEGLMVKSFFNPGWEDMGKLSEYGEYLGVQWVWTLMLIMYHATISTLIPITITESLWPEYRDKPLLGGRGIKLALSGLILITILGMIFSGTQEDGKNTPYYPNPLLLIFSFVTVLALIWLAYRFRKSRISINSTAILPPFAFGIAGFLFQALNLFIPYSLAQNDVSASVTLTFQVMLAIIAILFIVFQFGHHDLTIRHIIFLISGSALFLLIFGSIAGFARGMPAVGIFGLGFLIWWRRIVLKRSGEQMQPPQEGGIA